MNDNLPEDKWCYKIGFLTRLYQDMINEPIDEEDTFEVVGRSDESGAQMYDLRNIKTGHEIKDVSTLDFNEPRPFVG